MSGFFGFSNIDCVGYALFLLRSLLLDHATLVMIIQKIEISEKHEADWHVEREINIYYNLAGFVGLSADILYEGLTNEWYLRDFSRKQCAAYQALGKSGEPTTNRAIYCCKKDPSDKPHRIVDEKAANL